jgi:biotin carboxylase
MRLYLLALNPTDSVTEGFLPAAVSLGLDVTLLSDPAHTGAHRRACAGAGLPELETLECDVRDFREVVGRISRHRAPDAVFTNSDHLQTQAALAAGYFGLPAKDWKATLRTKNKAEMRRHLAASGADTVWSAEIAPGHDPDGPDSPEMRYVPYPCVVKPREGVASEDVFLAADPEELRRRCKEIRARRPQAPLVVEEYLHGQPRTLETLGDGRVLHILGGFRARLSPPPHFVEERLDFDSEPPPGARGALLAQLDALGVGFGACHTEYVLQDGHRPRIVEVNYRAIGDQCDLLLAGALGIPLFEHILLTHLGEPLPADLGARPGVAARVEWPCADRAGTLRAAPPAMDVTVDGVHIAYRPMRSVGERHDLYRTNRDYLGVVRATGTGAAAVDRAVDGFLARQRWEIVP